MALTEKLSAAMRTSSQRLARLPLVEALQAGTLPLESCVGLFDALAVIHAPLEQGVAQSPVLATLWDETMRRLPLLERDLAGLSGLAGDEPSVLRPATLRALAIASQVRHRAVFDAISGPASLLGTLWTIYAPDLAALFPRQRMEHVLGLAEATGSAYLVTRDRWVGPGWTAFSGRAESLLAAGSVEWRQAVEAVTEAAGGLAWVLEALHPLFPLRPAATAADLNPEAGSHAIPTDLKEVEAALVAGERSWRAWPYFAARYGARGQSYTRSDSAWIATLARHDQPTIDREIAWLGRLLAVRGMPRLLLEEHLRVLAEELVQALPERAADYARLAIAADRLAAERRAYLGEETQAELAATFERRIAPESARLLPGVGRLLVAAVADEQAGLPRAVASVVDWLVDPSHQPALPRDAVRSIVEQAHRLGH